MKKNSLLFFISFLVFSFNGFSQQSWSPIGLTVSGANSYNGVDAFYQLSNCNGEDAVLVKFVNHNAYAVTIEWYPGVFSTEQKWIRKENLADKKSIVLNPNAELAGDCTAANPCMIILLKDFSLAATNFARYGTSNFSITKK